MVSGRTARLHPVLDDKGRGVKHRDGIETIPLPPRAYTLLHRLATEEPGVVVLYPELFTLLWPGEVYDPDDFDRFYWHTFAIRTALRLGEWSPKVLRVRNSVGLYLDFSPGVLADRPARPKRFPRKAKGKPKKALPRP